MKASIIALCYNHALFLEDALNALSLLPEGLAEVIVVDDASTDDSPKILKDWQVKKPDWKFIFNQDNKGNCQSFNAALAISNGDWILDYATDDILIPEKFLDWILSAERNPNIGFCYADAFVFFEKKSTSYLFSSKLKENSSPEGEVFPKLFGPAFICPPAVLFRAAYLKAEGAYTSHLAYEDWDAWLRLSRKHRVSRFPEPVVYYRKHAKSLSASVFQNRNQKILNSTLDILKTTLQWPEFKQVEKKDFTTFIQYHIRLCFFLQLPNQANEFLQILNLSSKPVIIYHALVYFSGKLGFIYPIYRWIKS